MKLRRGHESGFSLHELLLAIALMGIITTWAAKSFVSVSDTWGKVRNAAELNDDATRAFAQLESDFSSVISPRLSGIPLKALPDSTKNGGAAVADSVVIPIQAVPDGAIRRVMGIAVSYHLDAKNGLMRTRGNLTDTEPVGYPNSVAKNISSIRFEYAGQSGSESWTPNWTGTALPKAVRVSLVLADPNHPEQAISRKAVFAIHVQ
ncbi:MAG: prepilin-type N-terminal cleavage/methylation domain-containing protein [Candidatus Hydrogenedentes bacterium]|nr:prepilin-type N-terminal cleavage/methylation domain-containing protein [Candidatus Hydrogenedentota bacterium]